MVGMVPTINFRYGYIEILDLFDLGIFLNKKMKIK